MRASCCIFKRRGRTAAAGPPSLHPSEAWPLSLAMLNLQHKRAHNKQQRKNSSSGSQCEGQRGRAEEGHSDARPPAAARSTLRHRDGTTLMPAAASRSSNSGWLRARQGRVSGQPAEGHATQSRQQTAQLGGGAAPDAALQPHACRLQRQNVVQVLQREGEAMVTATAAAGAGMAAASGPCTRVAAHSCHQHARPRWLACGRSCGRRNTSRMSTGPCTARRSRTTGRPRMCVTSG